ncbi:hypothetical protein BJ741DRAFT_595089 [Chytriomyces cf. hyalinus JEL632]|nr:hypothetical protein BJ741DRAFT_595089 [Chytriomyces cf. hyalinus JEL632]
MLELVAFETQTELEEFLRTSSDVRSDVIYTVKEEQTAPAPVGKRPTRQLRRTHSQLSEGTSAADAKEGIAGVAGLEEPNMSEGVTKKGMRGSGDAADGKKVKVDASDYDVCSLPQVLERSDSHHLQMGGCLMRAYKDFNKCKACIRKAGKGDVCRFRGFRVFKQTADGLSYGPSFYPAPIDAASLNTARSIHIDLDSESNSDVLIKVEDRHEIISSSHHEKYILRSTAPVLKTILDFEFDCLNYDPIGKKFTSQSRLAPFLRPPDNNCARHLCDECLTSLFNVYYACSVCAKEICRACYEGLPENTPADDNGAFRAYVSGSRDVLERCFVKGRSHSKLNFLTISKYSADVLSDMYARVQSVLEKGILEITPPLLPSTIPSADVPEYRDFSKDSRNYTRISSSTMNADDLFYSAWQRGETVVYEGGSGKTGDRWTAKYFIENYGSDHAVVVDCETKFGTSMAVSEFFKYWVDPSLKRKSILKLPDWPSHSEFEQKFPEHYADFKNAVPFPAYSSFTGALNLAARLPQNHLPPDLGPKMYNAFGSSDAGVKAYGTTPIHLDMADAVNVMMFASTVNADPNQPASNSDRPAAVWDIYARKDLECLRKFLRAEFDVDASQDPVHDQFYYIDEARREKLFVEHGVRGWRIFQNVGDAVFVPAGCAHQVCNYMDCVKAACDFVSPENLSACVQLTGEFRALSKTHRRREDLLSLRSILWSVWATSPLLVEAQQEEQEKGPDDGSSSASVPATENA